MKKFIKTTAKNAVMKGLIKEGDKVWVLVDVKGLYADSFTDKYGNFFDRELIRIPKPEPKPIDFGVAGRVLKNENGTIVMTTGHAYESYFSGYLLEDTKTTKKGITSNSWIADQNFWTDITDTYKP